MDLSRVISLLTITALAVILLLLRPTQENLIPYETASSLPPPCNSLLTTTNPMPNSPYGPYPPFKNMLRN